MWKGFLFSTILEDTHHFSSLHNGQKDHKCDSCGKTFSWAQYLKKHIISVQNGKKDHECDSCGNAFSQEGTLKTNINSIHNGQKDHKCDSCIVNVDN